MVYPPGSYDLDDQTYHCIADLICESSGLRFDDSYRHIVQRRLSARVRELQLDSFEQYYDYLKRESNRESELDLVFELITTNETYFFREQRQLAAFSDEILPEILHQNRPLKKLRIWSAGCASGEEPYSIAILCRRKEELADWDVGILANDISQKAIHAAQRGIYGESSFRNTEESFRKNYFEPEPDHKFRIKDEIRKMVSFEKWNLLEQQKSEALPEMDVIFCRNVIIYFDMEAKKKLIDIFYRKLCKSGYLLLGHSESLLSFSTQFKLVHLKNDMVYQK